MMIIIKRSLLLRLKSLCRFNKIYNDRDEAGDPVELFGSDVDFNLGLDRLKNIVLVAAMVVLGFKLVRALPFAIDDELEELLLS